MVRTAPTDITAMEATALPLTTDPPDRPRLTTTMGPVALITQVRATRTPMVAQLPVPPTPRMAPYTPVAGDIATSAARPITMGPARPPPEERPITALRAPASMRPGVLPQAANTGTPAAAAAGRMTTARLRGRRVRAAGVARMPAAGFTAGARQLERGNQQK